MTVENLGDLLAKTEDELSKEKLKMSSCIYFLKYIKKDLEESQKGLEEWNFDGYDPRLDLLIDEIKKFIERLDI